MDGSDESGTAAKRPDTRERVEAAFRRRFGGPPALGVRAPGRVNLLGGHTDTSEGWVLPAAIDRAVWLAARPATGVNTLVALDLDSEATIAAENLPPPVPRRGGSAEWIDYPAGVLWALGEAGHPVSPIEAVFASDVPIGAGVSSSAAVEVAFLLAWETVAGLGLDGVTRARLAQRAENDYVGVASGIMDQYASLHGAAGQLLLLDCRLLEHEALPLPAGLSLLVVDSGVRRSLADSGYNDRQQDCTEALAALRQRLPAATTLRDVSPAELERHAPGLPADPLRRARHVIEECRRVLRGAEALRASDVATFGHLMRLSHESSRDLYEVSTPELDLLAETAWGSAGCHGARLLGGGFGGCVVALVDATQAQTVGAEIAKAFERRFERRPESFSCRVGAGAAVEKA